LWWFDVVCTMEVIEHAADPKRFVAASLVKPGGLLLVSTLNRTLRSFALAIVGAEYVLRWLEAGTHRWEPFVTPLEVTGFARAAGLRRQSLRGMVYHRSGATGASRPIRRELFVGRNEAKARRSKRRSRRARWRHGGLGSFRPIGGRQTQTAHFKPARRKASI
jgi:hypothetical protein